MSALQSDSHLDEVFSNLRRPSASEQQFDHLDQVFDQLEPAPQVDPQQEAMDAGLEEASRYRPSRGGELDKMRRSIGSFVAQQMQESVSAQAEAGIARAQRFAAEPPKPIAIEEQISQVATTLTDQDIADFRSSFPEATKGMSVEEARQSAAQHRAFPHGFVTEPLPETITESLIRAPGRFARAVPRAAVEEAAITLGTVLGRASELIGAESAAESFFQEADLMRRRIERESEGGVAELAGGFVGIFFNPIYQGAFGLAGKLGGPVIKAIAGKTGQKAVDAAVKAGLKPAEAQRLGAFTEFITRSGAQGAAGFGTIGGIEGFAAEGTIEGTIEGVVYGVAIGVPLGVMFASVPVAARLLKRTVPLGVARQRLGLPIFGKLSEQQVKDAYRNTAKRTHPDAGGSDAAFVRTTQAYETLLREEVGARAISADPAEAAAPPVAEPEGRAGRAAEPTPAPEPRPLVRREAPVAQKPAEPPLPEVKPTVPREAKPAVPTRQEKRVELHEEIVAEPTPPAAPAEKPLPLLRPDDPLIDDASAALTANEIEKAGSILDQIQLKHGVEGRTVALQELINRGHRELIIDEPGIETIISPEDPLEIARRAGTGETRQLRLTERQAKVPAPPAAPAEPQPSPKPSKAQAPQPTRPSKPGTSTPARVVGAERPSQAIVAGKQKPGEVAEQLSLLSLEELGSLEKKTRTQQWAKERPILVRVFGEGYVKKNQSRLKSGRWSTKEQDALEDLKGADWKTVFAPPGLQAEVIATYRDAAGNVQAESPADLAEEITHDLTKVGTKTNLADMTEAEALAAFRIMRAGQWAAQKGWDTKPIIQDAIRRAGSRFADPEDAKLMLGRFLEPSVSAPQVGKQAAKEPARAEPAEAEAETKPGSLTSDSLTKTPRRELVKIARQFGINAKLSKPKLIAAIAKQNLSTRPTANPRRGFVLFPDRSGGAKEIDPGNMTIFDDGFSLPSETLWDRLVRRVQDRMRPLQKAQAAIVEQKGKITDASDAYLGEELFTGRIEFQLRDFERKRLRPLIALMRRNDISINELGQYLYARFAPDRNARINEINPDFEGPGSGMSNETATEIIQEFKEAGKLDDLNRVARLVDRINQRTRKWCVDSGLMSQEQVDGWIKSQGPNYVPLRTDMEADGGATVKLGQGFNIRGRESQLAAGRTSLADNPLVFSLLQHEAAIIRAEKNKVGQRLLRFVEDNPEANLWEIDTSKTKPSIDNNTGLVVHRYDPTFKLADNVLSIKVDGQQHLIVFKNQAIPLSRAMKRLGTESSGSVVRTLSAINRFLSAINTSYNPEFIVSNLVRDLQTAGFNITADESAALARQTVKNVPASIKGIMLALRGGGKGNKYSDAFHDFWSVGGKVGWFHMATLQDKAGQLVSMLKDVNPSSGRRILTAMRAVSQLIVDTNSAVENGVRLSFYIELQKIGFSKERAASGAKNLTVNFNRKGELGVIINALYLFSNATIQGTARMFKSAIFTKRGRRIVMGIIALGFLDDLRNRWLSGDDEDGENYYDEIESYVKERNLIIMIPGTDGKYGKVPLPYGYSVFYVIGQQAGETIFTDQTVGEGTANVLKSFLSSFSPLGSEAGVLQTLAPTVLDPVVQITTNRTFYGSRIKPDQQPYVPSKPESELYWDTVSPFSKELAAAVNRFTGGDEIVSGALDISPENMDHIAEFVTGGAGRTARLTAGTMGRIIKGEELPLRTIPFARRFAGEPSEFRFQRRFYKNRAELELVEHRVKFYDVNERTKDLAAAEREHSWLLDIAPDLKFYHKSVRRLNRELRDEPAENEAERASIEEEIRTLQVEANRVFLRAKRGQSSG